MHSSGHSACGVDATFEVFKKHCG